MSDVNCSSTQDLISAFVKELVVVRGRVHGVSLVRLLSYVMLGSQQIL